MEEEEGASLSPRLGSSKEKERTERDWRNEGSLESGVAQDKHFPLWSRNVIVRSLVRLQRGEPSPPPTGSLPVAQSTLSLSGQGCNTAACTVESKQCPVSSDAYLTPNSGQLTKICYSYIW